MESDDTPEKRIKKIRRDSPYLAPKEVAAFLSVTPQCLTAMRNRDAGPKYLRTGRYVKYHVDDVLKWIEENSHDPNKK
jgi:predicted DNA-binding transcriptional regulator AlpA